MDHMRLPPGFNSIQGRNSNIDNRIAVFRNAVSLTGDLGFVLRVVIQQPIAWTRWAVVLRYAPAKAMPGMPLRNADNVSFHQIVPAVAVVKVDINFKVIADHHILLSPALYSEVADRPDRICSDEHILTVLLNI